MKRTFHDKSKAQTKLISRSRVAEMLGGVCNRTVARKEKPHGILTPHRLSKTLVAYPESEVQTLIAQARTTQEAAA